MTQQRGGQYLRSIFVLVTGLCRFAEVYDNNSIYCNHSILSYGCVAKLIVHISLFSEEKVLSYTNEYKSSILNLVR